MNPDTGGKNIRSPGPAPEKKKSRRISFMWIYALIAAGLAVFYFVGGDTAAKEITWSNFKNDMLLEHDVDKINIVNNEIVEVHIRKESLAKEKYKTVRKASGFLRSEMPQYFFTIGSVDFFENQMKEAQSGFTEAQKVNEVFVKRGNGWSTLLSWIFPIGMVLLFWTLWKRAGTFGKGSGTSVFDFGRSGAHEYEKGKLSAITFNDIAGYEEAKSEVMEVVEFLKNPERFTRLGARIPKGILLLGPPGTGKTHMAKAVAGEAGVPFFSLSGSEFVEMFVGVGASRVRDLFRQAKEKAPSIVFIDEIDSIGKTRGAAISFQANDERESTLNQLLAEMDGFDRNTNVIVIAATNRPDILDSALLRPGRFDRHIFLELPNKQERDAIFKVHMKPLTIDKAMDVSDLVAMTPGFSGADIANVCNEAALVAAKNKKDTITKQDFTDAIDRIIGGPEKKNKIISPSEKRIIAYHEAGHAIVSWMLKKADPLYKISVIPRGRSLGAAMYLPTERQIYTYSQLLEYLAVALGGRTAEEIIFNETSSGAQDDLERVTKQAYAMVRDYGMSQNIGPLSFHDSSATYQSFQKPYSEATALLIDKEVTNLVDDAREKARTVLLGHLATLDELATLLIKKEVVYKDDLENILGKRPVRSTEPELIDKTHPVE